MHFGIQHGMGDPGWQPGILEPSAVRSFARAVEDAGYAHLAFTDHPAPSARWVASGGEGVAELFTALGFCAAVTERIRLLTWMLVVPYHNPLAMAHRVATLDALSGGRLTLGVGTGYLKSEFFAVGADFDDRRAAFDRGLDVLRQALSGGDVDAEGPGFSARGARVQPPAVQRPSPPLWIHGNGHFGLERAARAGQGWVALMMDRGRESTLRTPAIPDLAVLANRIDTLRARAEAHGRDPDTIEIVATSVVPLVDARRAWSRDDYAERFERLADLGVGSIIVNACGDDAVASEDGALRFAADFIRPERGDGD